MFMFRFYLMSYKVRKFYTRVDESGHPHIGQHSNPEQLLYSTKTDVVVCNTERLRLHVYNLYETCFESASSACQALNQTNITYPLPLVMLRL